MRKGGKAKDLIAFFSARAHCEISAVPQLWQLDSWALIGGSIGFKILEWTASLDRSIDLQLRRNS